MELFDDVVKSKSAKPWRGCLQVGSIALALGGLSMLLTGQIEVFFWFSAFGLMIGLMILLHAQKSKKMMKKRRWLLETGVGIDAKIIRICPNYKTRSGDGRFLYTFTCVYVGSDRKSLAVESTPLSLEPLTGGGWGMSGLFDSSIAGLVLEAALYVSDAHKASRVEVQGDRFTAKVWLNPDDPDDYYVQVFYHPSEDAPSAGADDPPSPCSAL